MPSTITLTMRSNASLVTCADGLAAQEIVGTSSQPHVKAVSMKPASPTLMSRITLSTSLPTAIEGQPPPCTKSSYVALVGAKVLVSCRKPPTAMRVIKGSQVRLVCDVRPAIASSARSEAIRLLHAACVRIAARAVQGNRLCRNQDMQMSLHIPE